MDFYNQPLGPTFDKAASGQTAPYGARMVKLDSSYGKRSFRYLYNAHTASRAVGIPCFWSLTGTTYPGLEVTQAATANLYAFAGVHAETVAASAWGWVQTRGYTTSCYVANYGSATNANLLAGSYLQGADATDFLIWKVSAGADPVYSAYAVNVSSKASGSAPTVNSAMAVHLRGVFE